MITNFNTNSSPSFGSISFTKEALYYLAKKGIPTKEIEALKKAHENIDINVHFDRQSIPWSSKKDIGFSGTIHGVKKYIDLLSCEIDNFGQKSYVGETPLTRLYRSPLQFIKKMAEIAKNLDSLSKLEK